MGSLGNYAENLLLDYLFNNNIDVALSTADPTDDASGLTEPSGNSYARVATTAASWDTASGGALANTVAITFPEATGSWGTLTHFALFVGANMIAHGALSESKAITSGQIPEIPIGDLDVSLT